MIPLFSKLFGASSEPAPAPAFRGDEPEIRSAQVLVRSSGSFYHNLPDEDFCTWARGWSMSPQVLTAEDRERVLDRIRSEHTVWEPDRAS